MARGISLPLIPAPAAAYSIVSLSALVILVGFIRRRRSVSDLVAVNALAQDDILPDFEENRDEKIIPLVKFNYRDIPAAKFRPFNPKYNLTMGLESCPPSELVLLDQNYKSRISLRKHLLQTHTSDVLYSSSCSLPAIAELYTYLLRTYLPTRYPSHFILSPSGTLFTNLITHDTHPVFPPPTVRPKDPSPALKILSTTLEEDIMILQPSATSPEYILKAFAAFFPSGFSPLEKAEKPLSAMHCPENISASMNRYFARLKPGIGNAVKRYNWSIVTHDKLFALTGNHIHDGDVVDAELEKSGLDPAQFWLRVERQVLFRLPQTGAAVFIVKTYLYPLGEVKGEGLGRDLADAIEGLDEGVGWYKRRRIWGDKVVEFLRC